MEHLRKSSIQKYLNNSANNTILARGRTIKKANGCQLVSLDIENEKALYHVQSDSMDGSYQVNISKFGSSLTLQIKCECAYNWSGLCKHEIAALLDLDEQLQHIKYDQSFTVLHMASINESVIQSCLPNELYQTARQLAFSDHAEIETIGHQTIKAKLKYKNADYEVTIAKDGKQFNTTCNCSDTDYKICLHKAIVFLQMRFKYGTNAFAGLANWNDYKNSLLAEYGYSLNDEGLSGKFEFRMTDDKPELIVLDPSLIKLSQINQISEKYENSFNNATNNNNTEAKNAIFEGLKAYKKAKSEDDRFGLGYVFVLHREYEKNFELLPIVGKLNPETHQISSHISNFNDALTKWQTVNTFSIPEIDAADNALLKIIRNLTQLTLSLTAETSAPKIVNINSYSRKKNNPNASLEKQEELFYQLQPVLIKAFELLKNKQVFYHNNIGKSLSLNNLLPLQLITDPISLGFVLEETSDLYYLTGYVKTASGWQIPFGELTLYAPCLLFVNDHLLILPNGKDLALIKHLINNNGLSIKKTAFPVLLRQLILPLQLRYEVAININQNWQNIAPKPLARIYLTDANDEMVAFRPAVYYEGYMVSPDNLEATFVVEQQGELYQITRDKSFETQFFDFFAQQHPLFNEQLSQNPTAPYCLLPFDELLKDAWFLDFAAAMHAQQIELMGVKQLSRFNYSLHKPEMQWRVSSGIDWFDMEADIKFGTETVTLKDVQRAVMRNERFVKLSDGTMGVLPEEWLKRYETILKIGDVKGNKLKLSKIHFSLLDELYQEIDDASTLLELEDKKRKLRLFNQIESKPLPKNVLANLRPYQAEGFNWLTFLDEFKWGGCLADDMGLGKTLQVLTFLQHQKQQNSLQHHLIVVPTSLLFNWEAEVRKFTPDLTFYTHHGINRNRIGKQQFDEFDLIITSYGTLVADIELFSDLYFSYIVLDESQSIKNPNTKRYKAVRLLKSHNRIALSGTPIENNTFDLYAQMSFLNPGMLGSTEFFKTEFANPIDKNNDTEKVEVLRKLIFPFVLRRTKEMVAKDLPEKTETTHYCEMGSQQRRIYEAFKNEYRFKILDRIDQDGMEKSGIYILEGLLKLRQICDSPALLPGPEDYGHESAKLDVLMELLEEITNNHKILVFSQFLGMLDLLRQRLEKNNITYTYLDGSTNTNNRRNAVDKFQEDEQVRVFLISLKAGGLGLNLTAADYVFLLDPWWNPAVEAQAIDRTHRIGQTRNIFAYKMVCKDSIEEKILLLQAKKKALAYDLVAADAKFVKQLTREDVAYLFT